MSAGGQAAPSRDSAKSAPGQVGLRDRPVSPEQSARSPAGIKPLEDSLFIPFAPLALRSDSTAGVDYRSGKEIFFSLLLPISRFRRRSLGTPETQNGHLPRPLDRLRRLRLGCFWRNSARAKATGARGFQRPISQACSESVVTGRPASRRTRAASYWLKPWAWRQALSCWMSCQTQNYLQIRAA